MSEFNPRHLGRVPGGSIQSLLRESLNDVPTVHPYDHVEQFVGLKVPSPPYHLTTRLRWPAMRPFLAARE